MVTVAEALSAYNAQHGTAYTGKTDLGAALVKQALIEAWAAKKRSDAHDAAVSEAGGL